MLLKERNLNLVGDNYLYNLINNKNICILGSAPSVLYNKHDTIESYDTIVRMNNYDIDKYSDSIGSRTDIYYSFFGCSIKKNQDDFIREGVKLIISRLPYVNFTKHNSGKTENGKSGDWRKFIDSKPDDYFGNIPLYINSLSNFIDIYNILSRVPSTGVQCIFDIFRFSPKSLYVTGFDFFKSGKHNIDEDWKSNDGNHNIIGEEILVKSLYELSRGDILLDNHMLGMMENIQLRMAYGLV